VFLPLQNLPACIAIASGHEVEGKAMKAILPLKLFVQVTEQGFIEMDGCSTTAAHEVMMGLSFYGFVAWLLTQKMIFTYKPQFT
jgi:hypothetical protein